MAEKLKQLLRLWKAFGQAIGDFVARVVLTIFYFTIFLPFGVAARLFGNSFGAGSASNASFWQQRATRDKKLSDARKQF